MKIRRYTCKDMQEALIKVKMDLGSEAVIMNSKKVKPKGFLGLFKKPMIEVVAAIDDDYVRPGRSNYSQRQAPAYGAFRPQSNPEKYMPAPEPIVEPPSVQNEKYIQSTPAQAVAVSENIAPTQENQKISELEDKVKSIESMLDKIYKVVQVNNEIGTTEVASKIVQEAENQVIEEKINVIEDNNDNENSPEFEENFLLSLRNILFEKDVEPKLIEKILEKIRERGGQSLKKEEVFQLAAKVLEVLLGEPEPIKLIEEKKPHVAIFIGPTGVGKTTTLAKIAADFTLRQKKVGLITADTYRIAAVEQLKTYAEILNLKVTVVYSPGEIKDAIESLKSNDLILIDTAGRSHKNKKHFDELKALVNAAGADETYLVMSSNISRIAVREILEFYAFIKNYKLLFTKLDESPATGVILNARYMTGKPLSYTTAGQSVPDDLDIANVKQLVASILD